VTRECRNIFHLMLAIAACWSHPIKSTGQVVCSTQKVLGEATDVSVANSKTIRTSEPVNEALQLACQRANAPDDGVAMRNTMIIGFVGGFVKQDDLNHPEVKFAALLSEVHPSIHAQVFANHQGKKALRQVLQLLDTNRDGIITESEKQQARIIIYGHSWGASQAVALARALGKRGVPVLLTIQIDSVRKPGQDDATIPSNVKNAINFYQTAGIIHGRSMIRAADPEVTDILGNFQMSYRAHRINCENTPWFARYFTAPHQEIENDPEVWKEIATVIDTTLFKTTTVVSASLPSEPVALK
jgi:hypothetical protein